MSVRRLILDNIQEITTRQQNNSNMKSILISLLLLTASLSFKLEIGAQITLDQAYQLSCAGAQGPVSYQASNLPAGVRLNNNKIEVFDNSKASAGYYPVKIKAQDAAGSVDERIVVVSISGSNTYSVTGGNTVAFNAGNFFANQGVRTVTITESSSSSSSGNIRGGSGLTNVAGGAAGAAGAGSAGASAPQPAPLPQPDAGVGALLDSLQVPTSFGPSTPAGSSAPGSGIPAGGAPGSVTPGADSGFPALSFPTGGNPNYPNFGPIAIADSQAPRTPSNRFPITSDDVKVKAAFERQINAARALANLLQIVTQATSNKNAAQEETTKRQDLYDQAVKRQRDAQSVVTKAEGDVARIRQAITLITDNINQLKKKIADSDSVDRDLRNQRDTVTQGLQTAQAQLNDVNNQIAVNQRNLNDAIDGKVAKESQCGGYDNEISTARADRDNKVGQLSDLTYRLAGAKDKAAADAQRVKDLEDQLAAARNALANSQRAVNDLANQQNAINAAIADLTRRIDDLTARKNNCGADLAAIAARIQSLRDNADALAQKKNKIESEIRTLTDKVTSLTNQINKLPTQLNDYNNQLAQLNKNLAYLRNQLPIFQRIQNDAYVAGNTANDQVKAAKQNLDVAVARFTAEQRNEATATNNIELARIEKDKADQGVDAVMRDRVSILPYAAAASEDANAPAAVLRPDGTFSINSWSDFVAAGYGSGVKPLFVGDLKTLYSFRLPGQSPAGAAGGANPTTAGASAPEGVAGSVSPAGGVTGAGGAGAGVAGAGVGGAGDCAVSNPRAFSGFVVGIAPGSFRVLGDGGATFQVTYSDCTTALANKPNYNLAIGDVVVIKGQPNGSNNFKASNVACLSS